MIQGQTKVAYMTFTPQTLHYATLYCGRVLTTGYWLCLLLHVALSVLPKPIPRGNHNHNFERPVIVWLIVDLVVGSASQHWSADQVPMPYPRQYSLQLVESVGMLWCKETGSMKDSAVTAVTCIGNWHSFLVQSLSWHVDVSRQLKTKNKLKVIHLLYLGFRGIPLKFFSAFIINFPVNSLYVSLEAFVVIYWFKRRIPHSVCLRN